MALHWLLVINKSTSVLSYPRIKKPLRSLLKCVFWGFKAHILLTQSPKARVRHLSTVLQFPPIQWDAEHITYSSHPNLLTAPVR